MSLFLDLCIKVKYEGNYEIVEVSDECNNISVKNHREVFRSNIKSIISSKLELSDLQFSNMQFTYELSLPLLSTLDSHLRLTESVSVSFLLLINNDSAFSHSIISSSVGMYAYYFQSVIDLSLDIFNLRISYTFVLYLKIYL